MKNISRMILPAVLLMAFLAGSAEAQTKIATVNLKNLFDNYYKTKQAQASLDDRKAQIDKDETGMINDLKQGNADYQQLLAKANDQALSSDERDKSQRDAAAKLKQLQDAKAALDQYDSTAKANLSDQYQRMRGKILDKIQSVVADTAKARGYSLVLDSAAETVNQTPAIIYDSGEADLTGDVLKQLNAGAPIGFNTTNSVLTAPAPSLMSTNNP